MLRKITYGILGFITLAVLVALIWLFFIFNPNQYKQTIETQFYQHTQMSLQIKGDIGWKLMPTELILNDVAIQDQHNDVDTHWQMVEVHVSLWRLLFDRHNLLEKLSLSQGQLSVQQHHFGFDHITLVPEAQGFMLQVHGEFNQAPLLVETHIQLSAEQVILNNTRLEMTWADPQRRFPVVIEAPRVVYASHEQVLNIEPIALGVAKNAMTLNIQTPSLQPLVASAQLHAPNLAVEQLVDLHGAALNLKNLLVDADYHGVTQAGKVDITADSGELKGINLSDMSKSTQEMIVSLRQGRHLGQVLQQLQTTFAPLMSDKKINADNGMVTHFDQVVMRNRYDSQAWQTTTLQLSGNRFKLTGTGRGGFEPLVFNYPLQLEILGATPLTIPYTAIMTPQGFQGKLDEQAIQKQLQPLIVDALRSNLQGIFAR